MTVAKGRFPLYEMNVNGQIQFLSLGDAGAAFDSGWAAIAIGTRVIEEDGSPRQMTDEDKTRIQDVADAHSENK